jgi:CheY-like chemotaxis protein
VPQASDEPAPAPPLAVAAPAGAPTVLCIEDDARDRVWLVETLQRAGYAVDWACDGAEGIARCRERAYDAITLDLLLPDMNGRDVLKVVRGEGLNVATPVIIVTVVSEKGIAAGFHVQDILVKPVQDEDLLAALKRAAVEPDGNHSVLVVDDNPNDLKLVEIALGRLGYRCRCVADGLAALEQAEREPPAAIVLDLAMPGFDGFEFLARFRATPAGLRTPVIVWTVKDLTRAERAKLEAAAQAVVLKSEGTAALLAELQTHVPAAPKAVPIEGAS